MNHRGHRPTSFCGRLLQFFEDNPDEELTYDDVVAKFDVPKKTAYSRVADLDREGELEVVTIVRARRRGVGA